MMSLTAVVVVVCESIQKDENLNDNDNDVDDFIS